MTELNGKVFVITGSGDGIGRTTAQVAAQKGAHIIVNDLNPDAAEETAKLIKNDGGKADHFQLDVTDRDAVFELAKRVETDFGGADLLLNNAGVSMRVSVEKMTVEEMEWMMGINVYGVLNGTQAFLSQIKESNGHIINVSSILGLIGMSTQSAYNAAKFAVAGFSEALRLEMLDHDVRVSTVFPGGVRTKIATRTRPPPSPPPPPKMKILRKPEVNCKKGSIKWLSQRRWMPVRLLLKA
ncbi:MAG: SDR family NAD(P)-dependent oxidoreductase [Candidatus Micropelagos sp.]